MISPLSVIIIMSNENTAAANSSGGNSTEPVYYIHPVEDESPETVKLICSLGLVAFALALGWAFRKMADHFADKDLAKANAAAAAKAAATAEGEEEEERLRQEESSSSQSGGSPARERSAAVQFESAAVAVTVQGSRRGAGETKVREKLRAAEMIGQLRLGSQQREANDKLPPPPPTDGDRGDGIDDMIERIISGKGQTTPVKPQPGSADPDAASDSAATGERERGPWTSQKSFSWGESSCGGGSSKEVETPGAEVESSSPAAPPPTTSLGGLFIVSEIVRRLRNIRQARTRRPNKIDSETAFTSSPTGDAVVGTAGRAPTVDPEDV